MQPRCQVNRTDTSDDHLGSQFDNLITDLMSIGIIDRLEVIAIQEN